jgi:hypothetical protein
MTTVFPSPLASLSASPRSSPEKPKQSIEISTVEPRNGEHGTAAPPYPLTPRQPLLIPSRWAPTTVRRDGGDGGRLAGVPGHPDRRRQGMFERLMSAPPKIVHFFLEFIGLYI